MNTIIPGLDVSINGAMAMLGLAANIRGLYDAVVYSGRSGAFIAALHSQHPQMRTVPCCVLPSKWHAIGEEGAKSPLALRRKQLRHIGRPISDLLKPSIPEGLRNSYQNWLCGLPGWRLPIERPRLLLIDDTVTNVPNSTYALIRRTAYACGARVIGFIAGREGMDNGIDGFHTDAEWMRWAHFTNAELRQDKRELSRLLELERNGKLEGDEFLLDLAEMFRDELHASAA
jgi:hypothetical protein